MKVIFAAAVLAFALTACRQPGAGEAEQDGREEQVAALQQQVALLQGELDELSRNAFLQTDQSLIAMEQARRAFYERNYGGMVPESVQSVASSINMAISTGSPIERFTAYVYELEEKDERLMLVIDRVERNIEWLPDDDGSQEYLLNPGQKKETIEVPRGTCLAIDPESQLTLASIDEGFGTYLDIQEGEQPRVFDFYTSGGKILFIIEAFTP